MKITGWFDGAYDSESQIASYGALLKIDGETIWEEHGQAGKGLEMTCNVAEYCGLIALLEEIKRRDLKVVTVHGDSRMVIRQMAGSYKAKRGAYIPYFHRSRELAASMTTALNYQWLPRERNMEADNLSKGLVSNADSKFA